MPSYGERWPTYAQQWDAMLRTKKSMADAAAKRIYYNKARYQTVAAQFAKVHPGADVPWYWIGPTHYRESDLDFSTQLAQGDPLNEVSHNKPRGEGPYFGPDAWERAAVIALEGKNLQAVRDWRLEKLLYWWEAYNGTGYYSHGVPSAYVFAGTNIYEGGFYPSDGKWNGSARDPRVGTAAVLKSLMELDPTIQPVRETPMGVEPAPGPQPVPQPIPVPVPVPAPSPPPPAQEIPMNPQVLIALLQLGAGFVPMIAAFYPPLAPFVPLIQKALPVILKVLQDWDKIAQASPEAANGVQTVLTDLLKQLPQLTGPKA
jgi:lysozyme family protein